MSLGNSRWLFLDEVDSTQTIAQEFLVGERAGDIPTVILAQSQTGGRGRLGRTWSSPKGECLAMTWLLREEVEHPNPWILGMKAGVAVAQTIGCQLRWPNDLVIGEKKVGGILTELISDVVQRAVPVIGIGVNLNQESFPEEIQSIATSLRLQDGIWHDPENLARKIVSAFDELGDISTWTELKSYWMPLDATPGKLYRNAQGRMVKGVGVGDQGQLIGDLDGKLVEILAAEAIFGA